MSEPLVSIITVVRNGEQHIEQAIQSVQKQTYPNIEHIIIDGASTDNTMAIIERHRTHLAHIVSEVDTGIYNAINKGINLSSGEIIGVLNSDDFYLQETIRAVVDCFQSSNAEIVYGNIEKLREIKGQEYRQTAKPDITIMDQTMGLLHPATFIKRSTYNVHGLYDERYQVSADYELLLRYYLTSVKFECLDEVLTVFRMEGLSNISCTSYEEGYAILQHYNTGHQDEMKKLIGKCRRKRFFKKTVYGLVAAFGFAGYLERRLIKKWSRAGK